MFHLAVLFFTFVCWTTVTSADAQVSQVALADVQTQGVCNASLQLKNCGGVLNIARDDRHAWPSDVESAQPLYGQTEEYTLFADSHNSFVRFFAILATKKFTCSIPGVQESAIFRCSITHAPALIMSVLRI